MLGWEWNLHPSAPKMPPILLGHSGNSQSWSLNLGGLATDLTLIHAPLFPLLPTGLALQLQVLSCHLLLRAGLPSYTGSGNYPHRTLPVFHQPWPCPRLPLRLGVCCSLSQKRLSDPSHLVLVQQLSPQLPVFPVIFCGVPGDPTCWPLWP